MLERPKRANIFLTDSENTALRMHECGQNEYWFYHKGSNPNDSPLLYQELVDSAISEIIIWDPYFHIQSPNGDQEVFANIQNDITIKILTSRSLFRNSTYLADFKNSIKTVIPEAKNTRFGLRVINQTDTHNQGGRFFHDRFLIIDNKDVYLIGSSIEYHLRFENAVSTGIFKVSNNETKDFIKSIFKYYWDNSTQHEIPLTFLYL